MTKPDELSQLFRIHPETNRIVAFGSDAAITRSNQSPALAITAQLLDPGDKTPSGKWLLLQVQPTDALILMGAIFSHAKEMDWPIPPNLLEEIETTQLSPDTKAH